MRERNKRQSTATTTKGKGREEINLLTELPDKEKYYSMGLDNLRIEYYEAILAWQKAQTAESATRERAAAAKKGGPLTRNEIDDLMQDLMTNPVQAIDDLFDIQHMIAGIYFSRLEEEFKAILTRERRTDRLDGVIDLFGLEIMENTEGYASAYLDRSVESIPAAILPESLFRGAIGSRNTAHDPEDAAASDFIRENYAAIMGRLKRRRVLSQKPFRLPTTGLISLRQASLTTQLSRQQMRGSADNPGLFDHLLMEDDEKRRRGIIKGKGVQFFIEQYKETISKMGPEMRMLIKAAGAKARTDNNPEVTIFTDEWRRLRRLSDNQFAREQLMEAREGLKVWIRLDSDPALPKEAQGGADFALFQEVAPFHGGLHLLYGNTAWKVLNSKKSSDIQIPAEAFGLSLKKSPCAFDFICRLYENEDENAHNPDRRGWITVQTLMASSPEMKTEAEVIKYHRRKFREKIISPFEVALDYLEEAGLIEEWTYWDKNGEAVEAARDFKHFKGLEVHYTLTIEPNLTKKIEGRQRILQKREKARKALESKLIKKQEEAKLFADK